MDDKSKEFLEATGGDARAALASKPVPAQPVEPMTRFCPGCGSVGEVDYTKHLDCCPDGMQARIIPEQLARQCHDLFHAALDAIQVPAERDVAKILVSVEPGEDGMGREVYAKSVSEVVNLLTRMGERIEELESALSSAPAREPMSEEQAFQAIRPLCRDDQSARLLVEASMDEYRAIERHHGICKE